MLDTIRRVLLAVSLIVMGLGFSGCKDDGNGTPIQLAKIDMARMYGGWYLIATASRKFGWIYSRTPTIPTSDYQDLLTRFNALGYDTSKFVKFVQTPEEIGQPGVWSEGIH